MEDPRPADLLMLFMVDGEGQCYQVIHKLPEENLAVRVVSFLHHTRVSSWQKTVAEWGQTMTIHVAPAMGEQVTCIFWLAMPQKQRELGYSQILLAPYHNLNQCDLSSMKLSDVQYRVISTERLQILKMS